MIVQIFLVLVFLLVIYLVQSMIKPRKFPPGPMWYPYFGSSNKLYSLVKKHGSQFKAFLELSKEYSTDVLGMNLGGEPLVVFFGEKNYREVMNSELFEGRPDSFFMRMRCFGKRAGISLADGPLWRIHRRFTLTHLRNAGFGKGSMEKDIQDATLKFIDMIAEQGSKPIYPKDVLSLAVLNVLWKCAAGETIKPENWDYVQKLLHRRGHAFNLAGGLLNRAPWIRFILPGYSGYNTLVEVNKQFSDIIEETILRHKNKEIKGFDFINAFLEEMAKNRETFTDDQLKVVCIDLILAGSATTSHALEFALLQALRDQDMQKKVQDEIDLLLGNDTPGWSDSFRLIYTSAFLLESQRYYIISPLGGPRRVLEDTVVDGYFIPKNTTILLSVGDIHFDPNLFEDPHVFKPERFIDESGNLKLSEHMYPFGLGRRRCPGDALARMFIFIAFTGIMQHYTISCADDQLPSNKPEIGMFASPKKYRAIFTPRKPKAPKATN